jgi:hypothetical protein
MTPLIVICLLLAVSLGMTVLNPSGKVNKEDLDPANPGPAGAQGLAHVLSDHGVAVTIVRSQGELLDERVDGDTTVVVTSPTHLSARTAKVALSHAAPAAGLVLLDPDTEVTAGMGLPVRSHPTDLAGVRADCSNTALGMDLELDSADQAYTPTAAGGSDAPICFADKKNGGGAMVALPAAAGRPPVTLLGAEGLITNGAILGADNAAIALRLFGQSSRLIWYVPTVADIAAADSTSRAIAPAWFSPGLVLASSAVLFLCLWRGRRLGPLVTEPLPVVVRAVETTESRGRMYRKSRDRSRALAVLQLATRRRLAAYLGLSASSGINNVAAAAAAVSGRSYHDVLDLLSSPATYDDSSLLERANTLNQLEKEVRRK